MVIGKNLNIINCYRYGYLERELRRVLLRCKNLLLPCPINLNTVGCYFHHILDDEISRCNRILRYPKRTTVIIKSNLRV